MDHFFKEQRLASRIKSELVTKYFIAWANIMKKHTRCDKIGYVDLFSGPGRYEDGTPSTPLMILEQVLRRPDICNKLVMLFNDKNQTYVDQLKKEIRSFPGIEALKYPPQVFCSEIDEEVSDRILQMVSYPSLFFIDPWGYKGLTRDLIETVLRGWGSDCFFFLNYTRVNAAIENPLVERHMNALFGANRLQRMKDVIHTVEKRERDIFLLNELAGALRERGAKYMLPFAFRQSYRRPPSHYLVFVSKHVLGYEIAKDIMARSGQKEEGGSWFEHIDVPNLQLSLLRDLTPGPVDELARLIMERFGGKEVTFAEIYKQVAKGKPYTKQDVRNALLHLLRSGSIVIRCPTSPRRSGADEMAIGDKTLVAFVSKVQAC